MASEANSQEFSSPKVDSEILNRIYTLNKRMKLNVLSTELQLLNHGFNDILEKLSLQEELTKLYAALASTLPITHSRALLTMLEIPYANIPPSLFPTTKADATNIVDYALTLWVPEYIEGKLPNYLAEINYATVAPTHCPIIPPFLEEEGYEQLSLPKSPSPYDCYYYRDTFLWNYLKILDTTNIPTTLPPKEELERTYSPVIWDNNLNTTNNLRFGVSMDTHGTFQYSYTPKAPSQKKSNQIDMHDTADPLSLCNQYYEPIRLFLFSKFSHLPKNSRKFHSLPYLFSSTVVNTSNIKKGKAKIESLDFKPDERSYFFYEMCTGLSFTAELTALVLSFKKNDEIKFSFKAKEVITKAFIEFLKENHIFLTNCILVNWRIAAVRNAFLAISQSKTLDTISKSLNITVKEILRTHLIDHFIPLNGVSYPLGYNIPSIPHATQPSIYSKVALKIETSLRTHIDLSQCSKHDAMIKASVLRHEAMKFATSNTQLIPSIKGYMFLDDRIQNNEDFSILPNNSEVIPRLTTEEPIIPAASFEATSRNYYEKRLSEVCYYYNCQLTGDALNQDRSNSLPEHVPYVHILPNHLSVYQNQLRQQPTPAFIAIKSKFIAQAIVNCIAPSYDNPSTPPPTVELFASEIHTLLEDWSNTDTTEGGAMDHQFIYTEAIAIHPTISVNSDLAHKFRDLSSTACTTIMKRNLTFATMHNTFFDITPSRMIDLIHQCAHLHSEHLKGIACQEVALIVLSHLYTDQAVTQFQESLDDMPTAFPKETLDTVVQNYEAWVVHECFPNNTRGLGFFHYCNTSHPQVNAVINYAHKKATPFSIKDFPDSKAHIEDTFRKLHRALYPDGFIDYKMP